MSGRRFVAVAVALVGALLLSGCFALRQGREFTVGDEPNRVSLVIHRPYTASLDETAVHDALHRAAAEDMCFTWTFVSITGRYFTAKPAGTAGCR